MSDWHDQVPTDGTVELPPDPRALEGLGGNHSLETALADLVDNSIDAGATHVLIRLVRHHGRLRALYVIDNGHGMSPEVIDTAMTVGGQREYSSDDLGRFGLGLKAASFSQARNLTVLSRAAGSSAVGRRWTLGAERHGFACDKVPPQFAEEELSRGESIPWSGNGTIVRWDGVTAFPATDDVIRVEEFVTRTASAVLHHLGLVFHRLLETGRVEIALDVEDVSQTGPGPRFVVTPLNPFSYLRSGRSGYPKELVAVHQDVKIVFRCHIWPGRSTLPQFALAGSALDRQGLYYYRRDRLLQAGGWHGIHATDRRLQLARVEVEIDDDIVGLFRMNPEKSRVIVGPEFAQLAELARSSDGVSFADYLQTAEEAFRESRQRSRTRRSMLPPGKGFAPLVRRTIEDEIPLLDQELPIDIRWKRFDNDSFFNADREANTLWINERYRLALLGGRRGGLNDAPVIKAMLYLLIEDVFRGEYLGARDRDNIDLWQEILTAAAKSENS
ncbi:ATP-binding protein [Kribbella sp. NBC_00889]|uniref:ATP-binding protein n=1 Tax=Kribbella sp. NBC_00889 TaxID=2975974 RepID=UPI003866096F|nr:ATP-binding protein [Kribbella sp. NBC_00889]